MTLIPSSTPSSRPELFGRGSLTSILFVLMTNGCILLRGIQLTDPHLPHFLTLLTPPLPSFFLGRSSICSWAGRPAMNTSPLPGGIPHTQSSAVNSPPFEPSTGVPLSCTSRKWKAAEIQIISKLNVEIGLTCTLGWAIMVARMGRGFLLAPSTPPSLDLLTMPEGRAIDGLGVVFDPCRQRFSGSVSVAVNDTDLALLAFFMKWI